MGITKEVSSFKFRVSSERYAPTVWLGEKMGHRTPRSQPFVSRQVWAPRGRTGLWVVLMGPDGVGKSSVITGLASGLSTGFAGCTTYHLRAGVLRSSRETVTNCDPHGQAARGTVISAFKLVYLLVANWLGYFLAIRTQLARGQLILFDRYFPDCLIDPLRYRLPTECRRMAALVARLLPRPDLYVVLDAPANVLQERKREVTLAESERQRKEYATQLARMPSVAVVNAARPLADVVQDVVDRVIDFRLERYRERYEVA